MASLRAYILKVLLRKYKSWNVFVVVQGLPVYWAYANKQKACFAAFLDLPLEGGCTQVQWENWKDLKLHKRFGPIKGQEHCWESLSKPNDLQTMDSAEAKISGTSEKHSSFNRVCSTCCHVEGAEWANSMTSSFSSSTSGIPHPL